MGPTLPDEADRWANSLQTRLAESEAFAEAASGFSATFLFAIQPDDSYDGDARTVTVVIEDGTCPAAYAGVPDDYDFALRGPYGAWRDLLGGDLDLSSAVMGGPFDFDGSTMTVMRHRDAVAELVRAARAVDTEFGY